MRTALTSLVLVMIATAKAIGAESSVLRPWTKQFSKIIALAAIQSEPREKAHFAKRLHFEKFI